MSLEDEGLRASAPETEPRRPRFFAREIRVLAIDPVGAAVPGSCACCGAAASSSRSEQRTRDGQSLIVPYCDGCQAHASRVTTRALSAGLASLVAAASLALALPLAWTGSSLLGFVALVMAAAVAPFAALALWPKRPRPGHTAWGRAVWWTRRGELACTNGRWAAELAARAQVDPRIAVARERWLSPWTLAGPIVALVGAPLVHRLHHPLVRILNLTEARIEVFVDGDHVVGLEPTSAESPAAGVEIRVPAGTRRLSVVGAEGRPVAETAAVVVSGARHLFAPASDAHCFWLERARYGRSGDATLERQPLTGEGRFWVLPRGLDTWFSPNPEPSGADRRSSGGELLALRQARCVELPPELQSPP